MNNTTPSPLPDKPAWLKKLEEESWQAELIISGLAIYGTLLIPDLVEWLLDWCLASVDPRFFTLLYLFFIYLGIAAYMLIFIFIGHFVLRAVWIGLVGLNSVYPGGINENSETYARHFLQQFRADHPDQNKRIDQLDQVCSVLFALGAQLVMIFMAINVDIAIIGGCWYLVDNLLGETIGSAVSMGFFCIFIAYALFFLVSNLKWVRDRPFIVKWQYPVYKRANRIFLHIFARPASYLAMVFQTNLSLKHYSGMVLLLMIIVFFFFGARFINYRFVSFIRPSILYEHFDRNDRLVPEHYANLRKGDRRLLSLELESDVAKGEFLRVFVPMLAAENKVVETVCGEPVLTDKEPEKKEQERKFYLDCYRQLHRFYVNDSLYTSPDLVKYEHPNQGEDGVLVYLPTQNFKTGQNLLRIEKMGRDSAERRMQAVFWFEEE